MRGEGFEAAGPFNVKAGGLCMCLVNERKQRGYSLADIGQAQRSLVSVVVRRTHALGDTLKPGDLFYGPPVLPCHVAGDRAGECAVVAFDAHDAGSRDAQIGSAEVSYSDKIGSDKCIFKADQRVERNLGA